MYIFADASNPHQPLTVTKTRYLIEKLRTTRCLGFMKGACSCRMRVCADKHNECVFVCVCNISTEQRVI